MKKMELMTITFEAPIELNDTIEKIIAESAEDGWCIYKESENKVTFGIQSNDNYVIDYTQRLLAKNNIAIGNIKVQYNKELK
jgi:hypothetical protein